MSLSLLRFSGAAAATLAALCAAGAYPTWKFAGTDGLASMALAATIGFVGAIVGYLPSAFATGHEGTASVMAARLNASLLGVGARLVATLGGAFLVVLMGAVPARSPFFAWIAVDYAALLVLETALLVRATRRVGGKGPASA